jgi:tetratricopeptide (TPR) repeat protein
MPTAIGARLPACLKKLLIAILGMSCILVLNTSPAHAAKFGFGTQDSIRWIQDTSIKGPQGEELFLAYKFSHHSFLLPYSMTVEGYVLGVKGNSKAYYKLDDAQIKGLQARGLLPTPLPPYEISVIDYSIGYLAWVALAFLAIGGVGTLFAKKRQTRALPQLNYAIERHRAGEIDLAIENYTLAVQIDRKLASAFNLRGNAYEAKGEDGKAVTDYTMAITLEPKMLKPLVDRGTLMERKGQYDLAIQDFTRVIKLAKKEGAAYVQRGRVYLRKGEYDPAIKDFTKAIKIAPAFVDAYRYRGFAYSKKGQDELCRADLAKADSIAGQQPAPA